MSTYKVGDEFDVKPGTKEEDWPKCGNHGDEHLPGCVSMKILSIGPANVRVLLGNSTTYLYMHPARGFNIKVGPFDEYIRLGLITPKGAVKSETEFKVGDVFDIKPGVTDEEWKSCDGIDIMHTHPLSHNSHLEISRVDLSDNTLRLHYNENCDRWMLIRKFQLAVSRGYLIPRGSTTSTASSTKPVLNNKHNSGLCPRCGTQTVSFTQFSGFVSKDFICPKCKE